MNNVQTYKSVKTSQILVILSLLLFSYSISFAEIRKIKILYTSDEHGWIENNKDNGGAINMSSLYKNMSAFSDPEYIIISGGDNWTGPGLSTMTHGRAMQEVMTYMYYSVSAVGNHEFDFGLDTLIARTKSSSYPYLAANLRYKKNDSVPEYFKPYIIKTVNGVKIGILGLTNNDLPSLTTPSSIKDFNFKSYSSTLNEFVPEMKNSGADVIIVIAHVCFDTLETLKEQAKAMGITALLGAHCHTFTVDSGKDVFIAESAPYFRAAINLNIDYNTETKKVINTKFVKIDRDTNAVDKILKSKIEKYKKETDKILNEEIGYASENIKQSSNIMFNLLTDAWLKAFPEAQIAMSNRFGVRNSIFKGIIQVATIYGILPFENNLYIVKLKGLEIKENIEKYNAVVGGLNPLQGYKLKDGTIMQDDKEYNVIMPNFIYFGGDHFKVQVYNPVYYDTGENPRNPLIKFIKDKNTNESNPINNYIDKIPRIKELNSH